MKKTPGIKDLFTNINKKYGTNSIIESNTENFLNIERIPTGSYTLDYVLGGGLPKGRIIECFGEESSGKSTMAAYLVSVIQKLGGKILWVDAEYSFSKDYYRDIGVKIDDSLFISQPDCGEDGLGIVIEAVKTGEIDLIVVDSVSSLVPREELEGEIDKASVALQARMMSKALRMLTGSIADSKSVIIFINQIRDKVGVYFGNKTTTSGGKALNFYASIRLEVKKQQRIKGVNDEIIGNEVGLCAIKNKVAPPFRKGKIELIYSKGIDIASDFFEVAVAKKIIKKDGITYTYKTTKLGSGKDKSKDFLNNNNDILEEIKKEIYGKDEEKKQRDKKK